MSKQTDQDVRMERARTIYQQLGDREFGFMVGIRQMVATDDGLQFKFGRNKTRDNICKVRLDEGKDLYEMEFGHVRKVKFMTEYFIGRIYTELCWEDLARIFSHHTGMETRIPTIKGVQS